MAFSFWTALRGILIQDASDRSKQFAIEVDSGSTPNTRTTLLVSQTTDRTITFPSSGSSIVTPSSTDTFTNKTMDGDLNTFLDIAAASIKAVPADANKVLARDGSGAVVSINVPGITPVYQDDTFTIQNAADNTKQAMFDASGITAGQTRTFTFPDQNTTLVGKDTTDTLTNKTIDESNTIEIQDSNFTVVYSSQHTRQMNFNLVDIPNSTLRTLQVPTSNSRLVGDTSTDILSNKTFSDAPILQSSAEIVQISTPSNPATNNNKLYFKSDELLYSLTDAGVETRVSSITPTKQIFTASGTYTTPTSCKFIKVTAVGAGGGSGGLASNVGASAAAGGGGSGSTAITWITNPTTSYIVTIGTAGTAGTAGNNAGGTGGTTSFGSSICEAAGGAGGSGSASGSSLTSNAGGAGGVAAFGDVKFTGSQGGNGIIYSATGAIGGSGAASSMGPAESGVLNGTPGNPAGFGHGGAGKAAQNAGGTATGVAGHAGIVIVEEYY